jgi:hypothetical protein
MLLSLRNPPAGACCQTPPKRPPIGMVPQLGTLALRRQLTASISLRQFHDSVRPAGGRHFVYIVIRGRALDGGVGAAGEIDNVSQAL